MKRFAGFFLFSFLLILAGCQKELSIETSSNQSVGSLQSDVTGDCLPKVISGVYEQQIPLDGLTNTIEVTVDVQSTGTYKIYTDTVNGFYFTGTGIFTSTGTKTVILKGEGTPLADGIANFTVSYGNSDCVVSVTVLPAGGSTPAVFTLSGAPGACMGYMVAGSYTVGNVLTNSSFVDIQVNVTTPGTYSVSTSTSNGFSFTGTGFLANAGTDKIRLYATGTPAIAGTTNVPVTVGSSNCSFSVDVVAGADFTVDCANSTVNGTFTQGDILDVSNYIDLSVNVTSVGGYDISATLNGMTFSSSGTFTSTGSQFVKLQGSGIPALAGINNVPVSGGTGSCTVQVTVGAGTSTASGTWSFKKGTTTYSGTFTEADFDPTILPPFLDLYLYGKNANGDELEIELLDASAAFQNNEVYSMSTSAGNFGFFSFTGTEDLLATPFITNAMTLTVVTHNTTTKTITGTFSGTAEDENGVLQNITAGTFSVTYQ